MESTDSMKYGEPLLYDHNKRLIPWGQRDNYYKDGNMSVESMKEYETYKEKVIKDNQRLSRLAQSAKNFIFQEKDKVLFSLRKNKKDLSSA